MEQKLMKVYEKELKDEAKRQKEVREFSVLREQGWHSGESARLTPMWPRFVSRSRRQYVGWVCCWFLSLL